MKFHHVVDLGERRAAVLGEQIRHRFLLPGEVLLLLLHAARELRERLGVEVRVLPTEDVSEQRPQVAKKIGFLQGAGAKNQDLRFLRV